LSCNIPNPLLRWERYLITKKHSSWLNIPLLRNFWKVSWLMVWSSFVNPIFLTPRSLSTAFAISSFWIFWNARMIFLFAANDFNKSLIAILPMKYFFWFSRLSVSIPSAVFTILVLLGMIFSNAGNCILICGVVWYSLRSNISFHIPSVLWSICTRLG